MTPYEVGFLTKTAEYDIPQWRALQLVKLAKLSRASTASQNQNCKEPSVTGLQSLLKTSETDPSLQQATAIFKDWLTTKKHTVRPGEVLSGIARKYNVPLDSVIQENNLSSVLGIKPGQRIKIPVAVEQ